MQAYSPSILLPRPSKWTLPAVNSWQKSRKSLLSASLTKLLTAFAPRSSVASLSSSSRPHRLPDRLRSICFSAIPQINIACYPPLTLLLRPIKSRKSPLASLVASRRLSPSCQNNSGSSLQLLPKRFTNSSSSDLSRDSGAMTAGLSKPSQMAVAPLGPRRSVHASRSEPVAPVKQ